MGDDEGPILYVLVVGFHHKKGCQVEFSFPALVPGAPNECPPGWKYLPTLALPDGSHNYDEDTVFFHLPSLTNPKSVVYGISCFRQIPVERMKNLTADITRGTVQKSVCVLSKLPLYGHIQVKMTLITHAYFEEGDFSKVSLLEDTYHHLNSVLLQNDLAPQAFVGLSARDLILQWRHKVLLLFKLLLLERRVIFYRSPVQSLCSTILTLLSLHPFMIETGLDQSTCVKLSRPMSPMPDFSDDDQTPTSTPKIKTNNKLTNGSIPLELIDNIDRLTSTSTEKSIDCTTESNTELILEVTDCVETREEATNCDKPTLRSDASSETISDTNVHNNLNVLAQLSIENCGFPLPIFTQGYLCLPYLSLPYLDLLSDVNVRGYVVGATNVLFKQKRHLSDVLVDIENARIECQEVELQKQLHLTTEDLRFANYIVKHVAEERHDVFLDGVGWEGGEEWIRTQFRIYLLGLLRTSLLQDGNREVEHFNVNFVSTWKDTHNYKMWRSGNHSGIHDVSPGHPFAGQLSVADMKLRLAHTMQNTEGGRKLNQAMVSTGRAVATTSKAVGGAISQAKGAFSSWWSNLLVPPEGTKAIEVVNENPNDCEQPHDINEPETQEDDIIDDDNDNDMSNFSIATCIDNNLINGNLVMEQVENGPVICNKNNQVQNYIAQSGTVVSDNATHTPGEVHVV